jgi:hypothetical protein
MGKTAFICLADTREQMIAGLKDVLAHNKVQRRVVGTRTFAEFAKLDPSSAQLTMRARPLQIPPAKVPRQSRGSDMNDNAVLIRFDGHVWLEVIHLSGGVDSMCWFRDRKAAGETTVDWIACRGTSMPPNFVTAQVIAVVQYQDMRAIQVHYIHSEPKETAEVKPASKSVSVPVRKPFIAIHTKAK